MSRGKVYTVALASAVSILTVLLAVVVYVLSRPEIIGAAAVLSLALTDDPIFEASPLVVSPGGVHAATLLRVDRGGAFDGFYYSVALSEASPVRWDQARWKRSWIWESYRLEPCGVRWLDDARIEIVIPQVNYLGRTRLRDLNKVEPIPKLSEGSCADKARYR